MNTKKEKITVSASSGDYEVVIGKDLNYGELTLGVKNPCKVIVVSDDTVHSIYGKKVEESYRNAGYTVSTYIFPHGEPSKNMDTILSILAFLVKAQVTHKDLLVALGGGVVGDMTGFAASIYLRSMDFVQLPTTLLAAVDSSVGGKTGVDFMGGKNLVGAFHQPIGVFCDTNTFQTLPPEIISDGMAEVIKYSIIKDKGLFEELMEYHLIEPNSKQSENITQELFKQLIEDHGESSFNIIEICKTCIAIKAKIVELDEYDHGIRHLLNFGHTIGHGIEALSQYEVSHGSAVAIGMRIITKAAEKKGLTEEIFSDRLEYLLKKYGLHLSCNFKAEEIAEKAKSDKKRLGKEIHLVIPKRIGEAVTYQLPISELKAFISLGLEE